MTSWASSLIGGLVVRLLHARNPGRERAEVERIVGEPPAAALEVQLVGRGAARPAPGRDGPARRDAVAGVDEVPVVVSVDRDETPVVLDLDDATVAGLDAVRPPDVAARGADGRPGLRRDVDAGVPIVSPSAEGGRHGALHGPDEHDAQLIHVGHAELDVRRRAWHRRACALAALLRDDTGCARGRRQRNDEALADPDHDARARHTVLSHERGDGHAVSLRELDERVAGLHLVDARLRGRGPRGGAGVGGRPAPHSDEPRGAQAEHRDVTTPARPHGWNSAKRIPNDAKRPVGGSHRTVTFSTRESGGPFSSSRTNSLMTVPGPPARARPRPSLRFVTQPERARGSARGWA